MSMLIGIVGEVNPLLTELVRMSGLDVSDTVSVDEMHALLQHNWVQRGKFRYEIQGEPPSKDAIDLLNLLGSIDEVLPPEYERFFDGALLLGGLLSRVVARLEFLIKCHGDRPFKRLYFLGSQRAINPEKENWRDFCTARREFCSDDNLERLIKAAPKTEIQMMCSIVSLLDVPSQWDILPISTPDVPLLGAGYRPANTGDTFLQWQKETSFVQGKFLIGSSQPYVLYQQANAQRILPDYMELYAVGPKANTSLPLGTFLDNLAKQFYEERLLFMKRSAR